MSSPESLLTNLSARLGELGMMPTQIQHTNVGGYFFVNAYDELASSIVTDSVTTGFDKDFRVAALKSIVEWVERNAFLSGKAAGQRECQTERSDGFAAYPLQSPCAEANARENALTEAIERFVWASWWDNHSFSHSVRTNFTDEENELLKLANTFQPISNIVCVSPDMNNYSDYELLIYFAELKNGGVVSGGACGLKSNRSTTSLRAINELIRHSNGANKIRQGSQPSTFYESRLAYFLTQDGVNLVRKRTNNVGNRKVNLPSLVYDSSIEHPAKDVIYVHRCLFENQPPFVDGALERLCL